jgi:hypothetical protein
MKIKINFKNKISFAKIFFVFVLILIPVFSFAYSGTATNFYTPSSSSYSGTATNFYTPSSSSYSGTATNYYSPSKYSGTATNYYSPSRYSGTATNYYSPSSFTYGGTATNYYSPSRYSGTATNYYSPSRSTINSYLPSTCGSRCSGSTAGTYRYGSNTGGYTYGSSGGYNYLPTSSGGGAPLSLGVNYSDNDTIITDNSRTDNSVRIRNNIRNSSTTTNISCSNVGSASSTGNCNTVNNYVASNDNDDNDDDDLEVICRVSDTSIEEGDTVTFEVEIDGGRSSYRIEWDGDISGDDEEEKVRFNRSGTYRVSVEVRDANGDRDSDDCAAVKVKDEDDEDDDDNRVTVTTGSNLNTPSGNLAGLESVFLSQVPYTGPSDVLKTIGILAVIAVWSAAVAMYFKKQRAVKTISNKIAEFKNKNKEANKIA